MKTNSPVSPSECRRRSRPFRPFLLCWIVFTLAIPTTIAAQYRIQLMGTAGYEFTRAYAPVYDLTLLLYQRWGARLTHIPDFPLVDSHTSQQSDTVLSAGHIRGDLTLPLILRTIDYHSHAGAKNTPLDFATAYIGLGYQRLSGTYFQQSYAVGDQRLDRSENQYAIEVPVSAFTAGMCFGESILVIDFYLLYLRGRAEPTPFLNRSLDFEHWLLTVAIGLTF